MANNFLLSAKGDPTKKKAEPISDAQFQNFGNFANTTDSKDIAAYLGRKGLIGAGQIYSDHPDISNSKGIINAQSDWKPSAISQMLVRARALNLKTPTEISANKAALLGSLRPELAQAINHPTFTNIHPNFWPIFNDILKDQYANEAASKTPNLIASK